MAEYSVHEQLMLELVNRARLDPLSEAKRLGIDLNKNLAPGTLNGTPRAVLAPNDLLLDGAKLSGLLLEGGSSGASFVMTVGIGLNLVTHPADTPFRATDLATAGYGIDRDDLLAAL